MMSQAEPRTPPRFVPTLTEVVSVPDGVLPAPPQFEAPLAPLASPAAPPVAWGPDNLGTLSEQITCRVMAQLEQRLPALLEEHARLLSQSAAQALREELAAMVQEAVQTTCPSHDPLRAGDASQQRGSSAIHTANNDPG